MFAIIETGGKQYKVTQELIVRVERLDAEVGTQLTFDALLVEKDGEVKVGNPTVKGIQVKAEVVGQGKADKIIVFKYKSKKRTRTKQGHRQPFTAIKIVSIG